MDSVGPFEIVERLGAGVLGELFRAHDTRRDRLVALRVVHPRLVTDQLTHEALLADARAGAAFSHPHAAGLLEVVEEGEQLALVHELAGGRALSALIENGPLDPPLAIRIAEQVAGALGAAAGQGLLHRALEPSSILVDGGEAMLLDLGLSRWTGSGAARRAAVTALDANPASSNRDAARSARYVSPEQALGAPGDGRADVFSLGVILFEMLTGRVPFLPDDAGRRADSGSGSRAEAGQLPAAATLLKILQATPVPPSHLNPLVPAAADAIVQKALAKSLDARYPDCSALAADLSALAASLPPPVLAGRKTSAERRRAIQPDRRRSIPPETVSATGPETPPSPQAETAPALPSEPPVAAPAETPPVALPDLPSAAAAETASRPELSTAEGPPAPAGPAPSPGTVPARPGYRSRRPRRRARRLVAAAGVVLLLALVAAATVWFRGGAPWRGQPAATVRPIIVVLPFTVPGDEANTHFGPGFAEDVAARLSEIPGASVVGRTSIRTLTGGGGWRSLARRLGATTVVAGSVRPGQDALSADIEVLDAATGARRWSQHFEREPRQVSGLEAEIAGKVAEHFRLPTPTSNRWTRAGQRQIDPVAYDLYLQGRQAADRRDRSRAIGLYDQALLLDPRLVEARASLSLALYLEEYYAGSSRDPGSPGRALREAEAALAVDAELPAAHVAAALAAPTITAAASSLARALAYDPSNGEAWHHAGDLVSELQPARSIAFYRTSLALEPDIDANWRDIASVQAAIGDRAAAAESVARGEALRPDRPWWRQMRARLELEDHRYDGAAAALLTDPSAESTPIVWLMGRVVPLAMAGRLADARREANRMAERNPAFCEGRAVLAAVELDGGSSERGTQLVGEILADASRADAGPETRMCAALAAAAAGDPAEAASWLSKLAGDERALRVWTRQAIFGVGLSFRSGWYPWTKVIGSQPVQSATAQIQQSLQRLREEVERRLPSPPVPAGTGATPR